MLKGRFKLNEFADNLSYDGLKSLIKNWSSDKMNLAEDSANDVLDTVLVIDPADKEELNDYIRLIQKLDVRDDEKMNPPGCDEFKELCLIDSDEKFCQGHKDEDYWNKQPQSVKDRHDKRLNMEKIILA